jgi:hypothetical protein
MAEDASVSNSDDVGDERRRLWPLGSRERRSLEAAGALVCVVAALVQIIGATGESAVRSILLAAATIVVGGILLVACTRFSTALTGTFRVNFILACCVLVAAGVIGGFAGYLISHASHSAPPARSSGPVVNPSATIPSSPTPSSSSPTPKAKPRLHSLPRGIMVVPRLKLNGSNFCSWRLGAHPMPLASAHPARIRIDGRCNNPEDADPRTDGPTGIYSVSQQNPLDSIVALHDGTVIRLVCYTFGQVISDAVGNQTSVWLGIVLRGGERGYVPDVNAGNYDVRQLRGLGLHQCP